ncbi:MAG: hypothetical protein H7X77_02060 [Anaerolineae bacterium]|nr:hypothetical protein [Anaerolineae bacterium]
MQNTALRASVIRQIVQARYEIDTNYPPWARRSHPIVRRHLGVYWRVMTPQIEPVAYWYLVQTALIFLTIPLPFLFTVILPMVIVSGALLPAGLVYYGQALFSLANDSSRSMVNEIENSTMPLLMATPYTVRELLLCKIAGALWRQSETFTLLLSLAAYSQMPTIVLVYLNRFPPAEYGILAQLFMAVVFATSILRLPLEIFMAATIGHWIGANTTGRHAAAASTMLILLFYFILINLPRLLILSPMGQLFIDAALPLIAPITITAGLLRLTEDELMNKL